MDLKKKLLKMGFDHDGFEYTKEITNLIEGERVDDTAFISFCTETKTAWLEILNGDYDGKDSDNRLRSVCLVNIKNAKQLKNFLKKLEV